ncbi:MAG: efflux RND transporter periplasmic adaptor subunit [Burkholderiales bacterium]|nr:efflux RND transporter periplasmic adaptor subunit [Burkholderiales bacterium]
MTAWSAAPAGPAAAAPPRFIRPFALALALSLALAACSPGTEHAAAAPPPPEVGVVTVQPATVGLVTELPGRTEASRVAQVRARAAGILQRRLFHEGSDVRAGQPLFTIDDAPYRATLASARAQLARARATLMQAGAQAERDKPLLAAQAISQQEYVAAAAAQQQAEADVAAAQAAVQTAQINLGYAHVSAPIAGRIGRALVTEGALVGQGEATPLAVVQQIDPLYVNFTQSAAQLMRLRAQIAGGRLVDARGPAAAAVRVVLEDGSVYPLRGRLLFSDVTVDPSSDQVTLRAEIPNPQHVLLPGLYVRVRLEQAQAPGAMLLPQQAVQRGSAGDTVQVVAADGRVSTRTVRVGSAQGGQWVVLSGLQAGERVVVDGFQKLRPNAPVKAVAWQAPAASAAGTPAPR